MREFCALEHSTQTHLPHRASLKICENSMLWSTQLRPTCLKQLLGYFASSVLWSTFVQTHLPQKTEHEGASAGSAKRKQFLKSLLGVDRFGSVLLMHMVAFMRKDSSPNMSTTQICLPDMSTTPSVYHPICLPPDLSTTLN